MTPAPSPNSVGPAARCGLWQRLMLVGPGFVYVLAVLGSGDIVTNSAAGAEHGYALIWVLGLTLVFRYVWVSLSAKYVLVTGESLLEGYARVGKWVVWTLLASLIVLGHFYNMYALLMSGSALDLVFPLPTEWSTSIWGLSCAVGGFAMMYWGGYKTIENFVKALVATMGVSLLVAAFLSKPDPAGIVKGLLIPSMPGSEGLYSALFVVMALIGTEAGSITNLTYVYFIREKGWTDVSHIRQQRFDLVFSVACLFVMGMALQVAAAGTVRPLGIVLEGPEDLVRIFSETQGIIGWLVFVLGLWGASFSTFVGMTAGFGLIVTDIWRSVLFPSPDDPDGENWKKDTMRDPIYRWTVIFLTFSPLYILFSEVSPVWLALAVSSLVVIMVPILALALTKITNDRTLMGEYKNNIFTNTAMILLVLMAVYITYRNVMEWLAPLF